MRQLRTFGIALAIALGLNNNGCLPEPDCNETATCPPPPMVDAGSGDAPDASQGTRIDGGMSPPDASVSDSGGTPTMCSPGELRCSQTAQVIQQCDLLGTWRDTTVCPYACTGVGLTTACTGSCKPGDHSCGENNAPLVCNAMGQNQAQPACPTLCADGACSGECKPNATRCVSGSPNMFQTCDATGKWGLADACTFVCDAMTSQCAGECTPGAANRCSGNAVQSCDATGHWVTTSTCTATPCSAGQCRACAANEKQCNAGKPQTCSAAGAWVDDQPTACPFLCDAATGKCSGECVPGTDLCTAQISKHCGANGMYGAGTACPNICDATTGRCGGVCAPGTQRCNGASSQTCGANGQWGADTSCPFGCSATTGQCNACTDEAMSVTCGGGKCGPTMNNCGHMVMCATTCAGTGETCGGGGVNGVCGCRPETAVQTCGNGTRCGTLANNCGQQVTCTTSCTAPQTCAGGGTPNVCGCTPKTATVACTGKNCGSVSDGCTGTVTCGACTAPQTCGGGGTVNVCGCTPMAAAAACGTRTCGTAPNGCGGTVNCGSMNGGCPTGMVCNSNGTCASTCTPLTACPAGKNCGTIDNGCGTGTLTCGGGCPTGQTCGGGGTANVCGCTPVSMNSVCAGAGKNCGTVSNGCGGTYTCGTCSAPQTCGGGGTANMCGCTPLTVAQACTAAGKNCGTVDNGCGGTVACGNCSAPNTCGGGGTANLCGCTPLSMNQACAGRQCGSVSDGCAHTISCGTCAQGTVCGGTQCMCNATSCPGGCCNGSTCVAVVNENNMTCGGGANGSCRACGTGQGCCSGACIELQSDVGNCGACGRVCSGTTRCSGGQCVQCLGDGDCSGSMPRCDLTAHRCVQCLGNTDCAGNTPRCDLSVHACRCRAPSPTNILSNPSFDTDLSGWSGGDLNFSAFWNPEDAEGCPFSGSLQTQNGENGPNQCLSVSPNVTYFIGGKFRTAIPVDEGCYILFMTDPNCTVGTATSTFIPVSIPDTGGLWLQLSAAIPSPPDARTAFFYCQPQFANMDQMFVNSAGANF